MGGPQQSTKYACPDGITRSCRIAIDNDRLGDRDCPGQKLKGGFVADCHMPQSGQKTAENKCCHNVTQYI